MLETLLKLLSYHFIVRALVAGGLVSLCAALLGVSLVLKRYSMIGDGLSHVAFGALALAVALGASPLSVSLPVVVLAAFLLLRLSEGGKIKGDAAIALVSSASLAIGVLVLSFTTGMNTDVNSYMFGSALAMTQGEMYLGSAAAVVALILYVFFYNRIFTVTFDEDFARATGTNAGAFNMLLAALTAVIIVVGMRIMGAMLMSSLIIFPPLTAMRVFRSFKSVAICSALLALVCFFTGMAASFVFGAPAGASVVAVNAAAFFVFCAAGSVAYGAK